MSDLKRKTLKRKLSSLRVTLSASEAEKKKLAGLVNAEGQKGTSAEVRVGAVTKQLDEQRGLTAQALAQIELLNQQIAALRKQIAALENSLGRLGEAR